MKTAPRNWILICVGILIVATGAFLTLYPKFRDSNQRIRLKDNALTVVELIKACKGYANDHDGAFPGVWNDQYKIQTSTEAFNDLLKWDDSLTESQFYVRGNPLKRRRPNGDGVLTANENGYAYVAGQNLETPKHSPLILHEMESTGVYGANHPYFKEHRVVVGYLSGWVKIQYKVRHLEDGSGFTLNGIPGANMDHMLHEAEYDDEGRISNGLLAVPQENILQPQ